MIREAIDALVNERRDLSEDEAAGVMREIFAGEATPAQLGAFLAGLRLKGETVGEIAGMARVMRECAVRVVMDGELLDTCGTGGDGQGTFNVSTAAAFVAAGAGARVAKHGNRAMSSGCGSADVLEALGAKIAVGPESVAECIRQVGFGFMFAQAFHPSMKHAAGPRREIGVRTVFNVLGPLTNPAGATRQLVGVANRHLAPRLAEVLKRLGSRHALVVHGHEGVDEVSLAGPTHVHEVIGGETREYTVSPEEFGLTSAPTGWIRGGTPEQNATTMRRILSGEAGPLRDVVVLNAAGALVAADIVKDLAEGVRAAASAIDSGAAKERMEGFVELSQSLE